MIGVIREEPPARRRGRTGGSGRPLSPELVNAMRYVANNPDEWFRVGTYSTRGSASSAANRLRRRDWEETLSLKTRGKRAPEWDIVSRSFEDSEGAAVYARRRVRMRL